MKSYSIVVLEDFIELRGSIPLNEVENVMNFIRIWGCRDIVRCEDNVWRFKKDKIDDKAKT